MARLFNSLALTEIKTLKAIHVEKCLLTQLIMKEPCLRVLMTHRCCECLQQWDTTNASWQDPLQQKKWRANPFLPPRFVLPATSSSGPWRDVAVVKRSQPDVVYLAALRLSGPSEETHHHNRMMSDQGNTFGETRGCSVLLFFACIINILAVSLWVKQAVEDWWKL